MRMMTASSPYIASMSLRGVYIVGVGWPRSTPLISGSATQTA